MNRWISISLAMFTFNALIADQLVVDPYFSPYAGGEDLITINSALVDYDNIQKDSKITNGYKEKTYRLLSQFFIYSPINYFTTTLQHEVFGHGYRIREIGKSKVKVEAYQFNAPIPYSLGGASTEFMTESGKTHGFNRGMRASLFLQFN